MDGIDRINGMKRSSPGQAGARSVPIILFILLILSHSPVV